MLEIIFSPLSYLKIRHELKRAADWFYPAIFAAASCVLIFSFGQRGAISGPGGLVDRLILVCSVLPGFYIAAMAAIATFNRPNIDELMEEPSPTLVVRMGGRRNEIRLTRRRFLSHLFAFLCWESLFLLMSCVFAGIIGEGVIKMVPTSAAHGVVMAFCFVITLFFWQMICVTCLGLYYLGDRLFRPAY